MAQCTLNLPVDHVGLVARELSELLTTFRRLGFAVTQPRSLMTSKEAAGRVEEQGQQSAHIMFDQGYLELTAVTGSAQGMHLERYVGRPPGVHILAIRTESAREAWEAVRGAGLNPSSCAASARRISYGRTGEARFEWFMFDDNEFPEALVCLVDHLTPDLVFQPDVMVHPNGARALAEVLLCVEDLQEASGRFSKLEVKGAVGTEGLHGLVICDRTGLKRRFPALEPALGRIAGVTIEVDDLEKTAELIFDEGIGICQNDAGEVWVSPRDAGGALVAFREIPAG